jgi:hypothetical protein
MTLKEEMLSFDSTSFDLMNKIKAAALEVGDKEIAAKAGALAGLFAERIEFLKDAEVIDARPQG